MDNATHLTLDLTECLNSHRMQCDHCISAYLKQVVTEMGMTAMKYPTTVKFDSRDDLQSGVSGFIIIAESHCSVHTYPEHKLTYIDLFSCKDFDTAKMITLSNAYFGATYTNTNKIDRFSLPPGNSIGTMV